MQYQGSKQQRKPKRSLLAVAAIILTCGAIAIAMVRFGGSDAEAATFNTSQVTRGDIELTVTALGSLTPKNYVDVGTQVSGQLTRVYVEVGDTVEQNQLLAEIDPRLYEARVESGQASLDRLQAQLAQREAELELARIRHERNQTLLNSQAISQEAVQESSAALKVAEAQIGSLNAEIRVAQSSYEEAVTNLGFTKIYAPISGTVVSESALEGQTLNANQAAPIVVTVADLETMTVQAQVAEADVVKIQQGMPAYFTTLGMPDRKWQGEVRQVLPTPEIINDVVLYNVLIDVTNTEQLLLPDMTVQVFFIEASANDVVIAPIASLQQRGADYTALVMTDDGPQPRHIQVGVTDRLNAEIISGLQAGEMLLQPGARPAAGNNTNRPQRGPGMFGPSL